ncbi:hypothetical protein [Bradyrhizobium sp. WSM1417]|uniref:hypothetical protein n=1 Tax=Bradyrhizobium sp. WSM1417 TaxID=754500 RepID=UPI00047F58EA|nr:hypothetical protein [Bradyrhizobium sp. WSM1417]
MATNLGYDLLQRHPRLFPQDEPKLSFGHLDVREGWCDLVERLCVRIEMALQDGETFRFVGMLQKFGLLRIDWAGEVSASTRARIEEAEALAEARSSCTCEVCGAEGEKYHESKNVMVRCEAHAEGRPLIEARANNRLHLVRVVQPPNPPIRAVCRYDRENDVFIDAGSSTLPIEEN